MIFLFLLLLPSLESSLSPRWKPSPSLSSLSSSRSQRQSDGNHHFFSLNQPYYTRPEDFSIPSYSPPKAGESKERSFVPPSLLSQTSLGFFPPSSHISPPASKPRFQYPQSFPYPYETPSIHPTPPPSSTPPLSPPSSTPSSSTRVPSPSLSPTGPTGPEGSSRVPTDSSSSYSLSSSEGPSRGTTDSSSSYSHSSPEGSSKGRTDSSSSSYSPSNPSDERYSTPSNPIPPSNNLSPYFTGKRPSPPPFPSYRTPIVPGLRPGYANPSPPGGNAPFPSYPTLNPTTQNHNPYEGDGYTTNAYTVPSTNGYSTPGVSTNSYSSPGVSTNSYSNPGVSSFDSTPSHSSNPSEWDGYSTRSGFNPLLTSSTPYPFPNGYGSTNPYEGASSTPEAAAPHGASTVYTVPHRVSTVPHRVYTVPHGASTVPNEVSTVPHGVSSPPAYVPPNHKTGSEYESSPEGVSTVPHGVTTVPHGVSTVPRGVSTVPHEVSTVPHGVSSPPAYVPPNYKTGSEYESSPEGASPLPTIIQSTPSPFDYSNPSSNRILSIPSYSESSSHNSSPIPSSSSNSFSPSSPLQNGYESESDTTPFLPDSTQSDRSSSSSPSDAYDNSDSSIPSTSKSTHSPTSSNGSPSTPPNTSRIPNVHPTLAKSQYPSASSTSAYDAPSVTGSTPQYPSTPLHPSPSDSTHNYRNPSGDNSNPYGPPQSPTDIPHSNPTVSPSSHTGPLPSPSSGIYSVDFIPRTPKPSNISIYSPPRGGPKFMIHNETGSPAPPASNPYSFFSTVSPGEASTVSYDLPPPPPGSKEETPLRTNRIKGMAHILCMDSDTMRGVEVNALTVFPFEGTVSTLLNGKKECEKKFESNSGSTNVSVFFPYEECGLMKQNPDGSTEWDVQVLFTFPSSEESFLVQCQSQSIKYDKGSVPRRFEESLEEFQLIPIKIEQKAPLPTVLWSLTENNSTEVDIGTSQVMYFNLTPETEAYGFHVKNCFVIDEKSGDRHPVIDRKGCSSDMAAFTHPQYNTLDDTITSDWMAFKLPDHDSLHISCSYSICPDFPSSSGDNSSFCSTIPTPPLCPRTVATPFNSLSSYQALTKRDAAVEMTQRVEASLPILDSSPPSVQFTSFSLFSFILIPTLSSTSILIACALHFASRRFHI